MAVLLAASACITTLPAPASAPPTPSPDFAGTQLAKSRTSSVPTGLPSATHVIPTLAPTITMTLFPSITPLPTGTATFTPTPFGFKPSPTPAPPTIAISVTTQATDSADGYTTDWGSDYRCTLISKTPPSGTIVPPLQKYKVSWTLFNSGHKKWQNGNLLLVYLDGAKISSDSPVSLVRDVRVGESITPVINIFPPKDPGNYRSVWGLRLNTGLKVFCTFTFLVTVSN
jgi:hypothetical protein